jgi:hypothetical protein
MSLQRTVNVPQQALPGAQTVTSATRLVASGLIVLGGYDPNLLLVDSHSGEQAGFLKDAASGATLSLVAWQQEGSCHVSKAAATGASSAAASGPDHPTSTRELLGIGDANGGVSLLDVRQEDGWVRS